MKSDLNVLDDDLNIMIAQFELNDEFCGLKHSSEDPAEEHPAVDYLKQNLGNPKTGEAYQQIRIPICEECIVALTDPNWILMYCINCNKSQWVYRPKAKYDYPEGNRVYWMDVCPFCAEIANEYKGEE
jgi:hypothetical protein